MEVIILRGIPGAGKDHWLARYVRDNPVAWREVCSADHFWLQEDGITYKFDPSRLGEAHNWCLKKYLDILHSAEKPDLVFVNNTNLTAAEIAPYYRCADCLGIPVRIVRLHAPLEVCIRRNVHGVSASSMIQKYHTLMSEKLPWKEDVVLSEW